MNDKEFLLTYKVKDAGFIFKWFETEKDLLDRVEKLGDSVWFINAIQIKVVKNIIG